MFNMTSDLYITLSHLTNGHFLGSEPLLTDDESEGEKSHEPSSHFTCGERNGKRALNLVPLTVIF
jgi:hypothetical protein